MKSLLIASLLMFMWQPASADLTLTFTVTVHLDCEKPVDPPIPPVIVGEWDTWIPSASVNSQSGGYGSFSSDSQHIAIRHGRTWSIVAIDGTERVLTHPANGASSHDFMWASADNQYFWLNGQRLELYSLAGELQSSWPLTTSDTATVQWRSGTGSNRAKQFVLGSQEVSQDVYHQWMQAITVDGPQEGFWVRDLPGRPEYRWHNVYVRNDGYGGSLSGVNQTIEWITDYVGSYVKQVPKPGEERQHSHESWEGDETLFWYSVTDGLRLQKVTKDETTVLKEITQGELKAAIGTTAFVAGGHTDLRGDGALVSAVTYDQSIPADQRIWSVLYWDRSTIRMVYTGVKFNPANFHENLLPSLSPNNLYAAFHDQGGVRISSIPETDDN